LEKLVKVAAEKVTNLEGSESWPQDSQALHLALFFIVICLPGTQLPATVRMSYGRKEMDLIPESGQNGYPADWRDAVGGALLDSNG
jgi:hypothetical protein